MLVFKNDANNKERLKMRAMYNSLLFEDVRNLSYR